METVTLWQGDCLELMKNIPDGSVDLVLTDPPYGTTACKWDSVIPFEPMWEQLNRIIKPNGAICLFGSEPFSSALRMSNIKHYKYDWTWQKNTVDGFMNAKCRPLKKTENISVFSKKQARAGGDNMVYNPQNLIIANKKMKDNRGNKSDEHKYFRESRNGKEYIQRYTNYPSNLLIFDRDNGKLHPTQKPIALLEYLIRTYTNEGETVLDFTMGSGSTGVACVNTGRKFIGIELDQGYFDIAKERIEKSIRERD